MKKYCYCMTGNQVWFDAAVELYDRNIAEPVFWLGDDRHHKKAKEKFGKSVMRMQDFVHYQTNIQDINYDGEHIGFFTSENYLRAKDRCLKMMDRLDLYGIFGRIDRETIFHKLSIAILKNVEDSKPDAMVVAEMPHSHAQYLLYEICSYLEIEIVKFNTWMPVPLLFLQNVRTGERLKRKIPINKNLFEKIDLDINSHIKAVLDKDENYELPYMKTQRLQLGLINKILNFLKTGFLSFLKEAWFQIRKYYSSDYYHINPFKIGAFGRSKIQRTRKKNLIKHLNKNVDQINLDKDFVYFALHFEPERTTNPDGGIFHDQAIAILTLREFLPKNVDLYVKEHPSQFFMNDRGSRGRSPLFYEFIKNINGVRLVSPKQDSLDLIKKSIFTSTISGSVALESAIMEKKSLIFGDTWFNNCPNVTTWHNEINFREFINLPINSSKKIHEFLLDEKNLHGIPGCQNISAQKRFPNYMNEEFLDAELKGVTHLLEEFFKSIP